MKQRKDQEILVYDDFTQAGKKALEWGIFLSKNLKKQLFILHVINENSPNSGEYGKDKFSNANNRLEKLCTEIEQEHQVKVAYAYEEGCTCTIINSNAEKRDSLFVIAAIHGLNEIQYLSGKSLIKIVRKARIPYLVLHKESPAPELGKSFLFPISMQKEMKQKVGWATFFAFRMKIDIELFLPKEREDIANNLQFAKKFFSSYELDYKEIFTNTSQFKINTEAIKYADTSRVLMMCVITTLNVSLIDRIIGLPESRLCSNSKRLPILLVNPRKDLYVPCV
ncbi:MAG: universal stress protein [Bacteroidales bacterium]|nr:universal stress protein [Bacteroidales bacterium]